MAAKLLDGNRVASEVMAEVRAQIDPAAPPRLVMVLCSDDPASTLYVQRKQDRCAAVGIESRVIRHAGSDITQDQLLNTIHDLNEDASVNGILVQLPLPKQLDPNGVFDTIDPLKDVDVFSPANVGLLLQGRPRFVPCTPHGIQELLCRSGVPIEGKRVTIINRSDVVGKPLHALLIQNNFRANATVTLCHDHTDPSDLVEVSSTADIVVVAVGKPGFLKDHMVRSGAVVVDVGITRIPGSKRILGDVDFDAVAAKASWVSPVPGGVGPCTLACLLRNTVTAQKLQQTVIGPTKYSYGPATVQ